MTYNEDCKEVAKIPKELEYNYILDNYNPVTLPKTMRGIDTIEKSLQAKTPSLSLIKKYNGEHLLTAFVELHLASLALMINVARPLNEHQIKEIARLVVQKYWALTISDLNILFDRVKMGHFKIYETLSVHGVLSWFSEYFEERCLVAESNSIMNHESIKYKSEKGQDSGGFLELWKVIPKAEKDKIMSAFSVQDEKKKFKEEEYRKFYIEYLKSKENEDF